MGGGLGGGSGSGEEKIVDAPNVESTLPGNVIVLVEIKNYHATQEAYYGKIHRKRPPIKQRHPKTSLPRGSRPRGLLAHGTRGRWQWLENRKSRNITLE